MGKLTPPEKEKEAREHLRVLSARLHKHLRKVPWYRLFAALCVVREKEKILRASTELIG